MSPWWDCWGSNLHENLDSAGDFDIYNHRYSERIKISRGLFRDGPDAWGKIPENETLYITQEEAEYLHENHPFFIANHTMSHPNLTCLDTEELDEEIGSSIALLSTMPVYLPLLAYPFGSHNQAVIDYLLARNDISIAYATGRGLDDSQFTVHRVNLNTKPFALFAANCIAIFDFLDRPKRLAGFREPDKVQT